MTDWKSAASSVKWDVRPFINGRYQESNSNPRTRTVNPATERTLYEFAIGHTMDVDQAVQAARIGYNLGGWSGLPSTNRAQCLFRLADLVERSREQLALLDTLEMGKPIYDSLHEAGVVAPMLLRSWAGFADKCFGSSAPLTSNSILFNYFEPLGVIGAICPWNFPTVNAIYKFAPALAAGNSVVLKPSELASSSALKLAELALEAGIPEGILNVVPGLGRTSGAALALHTDVDMLSFTGSTPTGRRIMEMAGASNGKRLLLECGGKSPTVVFDDVSSIEVIGDAVAQSLLWNQGQVCSAHTRLVVHDAIKRDLMNSIFDAVARRHFGDPLEESTRYGPLAGPVQRDRVRAYMVQGIASGASVLLKGAVQESGGCYASPTIFECIDGEASIVRDEIFGPVLCVQPFKSEEEAVVLANGGAFGLAATVWTRDLGRGKRMAHKIRAGSVTVRTSGREGPSSGCILSYEAQKASGFGAEIGLKGLESYSNLKLANFVGD